MSKKFTMLLASLFLGLGTLWAQPEVGKEYRIKEANQNLYLTIQGYNGTGSNNARGSVPLLEKALVNADQVWTLEATGTENVYNLKSKSGYYIVQGGWNVDAYDNNANQAKVQFVSNGDDTYKIKNMHQGSQWWKSQEVGETWYPFCDAGDDAAASWVLEEVPAGEFAAEITLTIVYNFNGNKVSETSVEKLPGAGYTIPVLDYTKIASCKIGEEEQTVTDGACTITVPNAATTVTVELASNFPFEVSANYENATWYVLQIRSNNKKYVVRSESAPYANTTTTPTTEDALWAFVGNPFDGVQVLNKAAGTGKTLALDANNNAVMTEGATTWNITKGNGGFLLRNGNEGVNYLHDFNSTLKIWEDNGAATDPGSAFVVTSEAEMISLATTVMGLASKLDTYAEASYYTYPNAAVAEAKAILQDVTTPTDFLTALQAKATVESVQAALNTAGKSGAPAAGDVIQLKNKSYVKYLKANDADLTHVADKNDLTTLWVVEAGDEGNVKLKNYSTNEYIGEIRQSATVAMVEEASAKQFSWTNQTDMYAVFKETSGGDYAYGHINGSGVLVGWLPSADATQWVVSNVCPLSITYFYNSQKLGTSTIIAEKNAVYTVSSPYDFTTPSAVTVGEEPLEAVDGVFSFEVTEATTLTVELTDDLPFEKTVLNQDGSFPENTTWYVVKQHSGAGHTRTWKYDETNGVTAEQTNEYTDNHMWCFVGSKDDLKIYNKAAGSSVSLTNTDPAASMAAENAAVWKMVKSEAETPFEGGGSFCLQNGDANSYLNMQSGLLKYWDAKDNGSTIMVIAQSAVELTTLVNRLNGTINTMIENAGKGIGYYESAEDVAKLKNAIGKAQALLDSNNGKPEDFVAAIGELNEAETKAAKIAMPEAGKYYRIGYDFGSEVGVKYMESVNSSVRGLNMTSEAEGESTIFCYTDGKLQSLDTKKYLKEDGNTRGLHDGANNAGTVTFSAGDVFGKIKIQAPAYLHANVSNGNYFIDHCGGNNGDAQHNFIVEEVTSEELNELNGSYLNGCSYITTLAENSNHPVIVNNARSNWAVADNPTALNTLAKLGLAKAVFDTKQQFAFITPDEGENYYLYSVHAKRYLKSNNTFGAQGEPIQFNDASSLGENRVQVQFRDIADKFINVGGSNQVTIDWWSTIDEGNACEMVQCNTLTFDLDEALNIFNNGADITLTYKLGDKLVSTTTYETKGETFSFNNPYGYTSITSCKMNGEDLTPTDGTYSFTVAGDANIVVELLEEQLPFTLSENYENAVWYRLKIRPNANPTEWVVRKAEKPYDNVTTAPTDDNGLWAFVGNAIDGVHVLNKEAGDGYTLGFDNMNNTTPVYMKEGITTWTLGKLAKDDYEGFLLRQGTTGNKYLHDFNKQLKFWDSNSAPTDLGSAFVAEAPLSITYLYKGEELTEQKVDTYVNYGTTYTIVNPFAGATEYIAISECTATGNQPVETDGAWSVKVTEATSITVTLVDELPFEYAADVENISDWYYLKFHASYRKYLYYEADGVVLKTDVTEVDANNKDAYTWAFVGDPIEGFKLYNKAAGKYLDAVEAGAVVSATEQQVFKLAKSSYAVNGFFMQAKDGDYTQRFNMNGGVVYWSGADAGSTFMVELRPKEGAAAAAELLEVNENNHSAIPALGQYTTAAYEALQAAYEAPEATTESIEVAIAAFKASLNRPAYIITSAWDAGYPAGSAIYYDGAWKWKKASRYDRQMWMTIPGYTNEDVTTVSSFDVNNPSYGFCDYLKGAKMRNWDVQIVAVPGWPDAYSLQYSGGTYYKDAAMHAQSGGALVGWLPAALNDCQPSAWRVEYIGNTYDLDQLTEPKLQALANLQAAFESKVYLFDAVYGAGIGKYQGDENAIKEPLFAVSGVLAQKLGRLKELSVDQIESYTESLNGIAATINLPEDGKYYRIYGANSNVSPAGRYITNHTNADGGRIAVTEEADASTVYYYKDGKLQAHLGGKFIGVSINPNNYKFADSKDAASDITFAASSYVAGAYTIHSADCYLRYKVYNGEAEVDRGESEESANDAWYLQEVTEHTITYIYKNGKTELARQEVAGFIGLPYPAADAALPLGYVAPATLDGTVAENETEKVIACTYVKSQMPFQYADSYENIEHWYYLNIAANGYYLYHADGADHIALNKTAVDANNKDAYSWAFIGNPTDGFQIVNKAKGEGWILSSSTTMAGETGAETWPIMTELANLPDGNNTHWVHTKSTNRTNRDGFYMAQKGNANNRLNNRSSKLAYWTGGADAGSTLVAVEQYEMTQTYSGVGSWEVSPVYPEGLKTGAASGSHGNAAGHVGANGHTIYKSTKAIVTTEADVTVSFNYAAGNSHGLITLGVDVVNGNGDVVASDYHVGFTGGAQDNKLYTLRNLPAGNYILRCYVCNRDDQQDHYLGSTGGNIVVTYAKELTDVNAASAMWTTLKEKAQTVIAYKGEGLGYYNNADAVVENAAATPENTVAGYTAAFVALDDAIDNAFFALPEAGKFYRIKSMNANDANKKGKYWQVNSDATAMELNATAHDFNSIIYLGAGNTFLSYGSGLYLNDYDTPVAVGTEAKAWTITKNNVLPGSLALYRSGDGYCLSDWTGNATYGQNDGNAAWIFEEVTSLPVAVTAAQVSIKNEVGESETKCISTFYAPVALDVPAGVIACTGQVVDNYLALNAIESDVIPANTGVILLANAANAAVTYNFSIHNGVVDPIADNDIEGSVAKTLVAPEEGYNCYVLAKKNGNVGLYKASLNKNASNEAGTTHFINNACKAYIPVSKPAVEEPEQQARALTMRFGRGNEGTTEIDNSQLTIDNSQLIIYDLTGRRINEIVEKGIYIVNGKKVIIR